ncbi:MAG TPA: DUF4386 domain-containing protein [Pyrinomonadaceae bacterium]|nr:DUF4386 domain-containing protein [Pyrinomonadaceae bacterium]
MRSAKTTGRTIGVLLLLQMACGLIVPFVLWHPLIVGSPAFLTAAAASSFQIRAGVFLSFVGGALTVAIAITAWSIIRRYSETIALWFLVVCAISCTLDAMQNAAVMSMLSVSQEYAKAGTADAALITLTETVVATLVATVRRWVHYTQLLGFGAWIFLFYLSLWRFDLVPRALAILGLIGILLQFTGVTLLAFLGYSSVTQLAMPLAPIHIANGLWLIFKGFKEPHLPET